MAEETEQGVTITLSVDTGWVEGCKSQEMVSGFTGLPMQGNNFNVWLPWIWTHCLSYPYID